MKPISFCLRGWNVWTPEQQGMSGEGIPLLLRRRVTAQGQLALAAAWGLPEAANSRLILASRHGEFSRTLSLLESAVKSEELSPSDFTLSVHHALIGLLSIVQGNRKGHTAVAAGEESFCFGLIEAAACLHENPAEPVVLIYFDDLLPGPFASFEAINAHPLAFALALAADGEGDVFHVDYEAAPLNKTASVSHARDFLEFLGSNTFEKNSVGEHRQWRWTRDVLA